MTLVGGAVTVVLLFVLGILVYPALLGRGWAGRVAVAALTLALWALYAWFDRGRGTPLLSALLGLLWALAPVVAGVISRRVNARRAA